MKKLLLLGLCFLLFIVAYGCAQGDEGSAVISSSVAVSQNSESVISGSSNNFDDSDGSESASLQASAEDSSAESSVAASESSEDNENTSGETAESRSESESSEAESSEIENNSAPDDESSEIIEESSEIIEESSEIIEESSEIIEESSEIIEESSEVPPEESEPITPPDESEPITPPDESEDDEMQGIGDAELLDTGYIIYNGAAYHSTSYKPESAQAYADIYARYAEIFPNTRINVVTPPQSAINIKNPLVAAMTNDQGEVLDKMEKHIYGDVNFVNLRKTFEAHRGEYLYFKSDYHWTQLGAYYAYCDFAKSVGLTPTPLSAFEDFIVTDRFIGRTNDYAHDDRILSFYDTIHAYMPRKTHTMTVYDSDLNVVRVYKNCIKTDKESYSCFITGDQPYTVINVPENDQSKTVLVIKESSGNAFVPFLVEHYGNIIVIDPRQYNKNIRDLVEKEGVDDIIFHATASTCSRMGYYEYYCSLIGE